MQNKTRSVGTLSIVLALGVMLITIGVPGVSALGFSSFNWNNNFGTLAFRDNSVALNDNGDFATTNRVVNLDNDEFDSFHRVVALSGDDFASAVTSTSLDNDSFSHLRQVVALNGGALFERSTAIQLNNGLFWGSI